MARIWSCGFELNSSVEWLNALGTPAFSTSVVRGGSYSLQVGTLTSGQAKGADNSWSGGTNTPTYQTVWINVTTFPSAENTIFAFRNASTSLLYMTMDATGTIRLYAQGAVSVTGTASITTGSWNRLDLYYDGSTTAGTQTGTGRVNGTVFASSTALTYTLNSDRIIIGGNCNLEAQTTGLWYFDDWKINNTTGSSENSWPSDGKIIHLRPTGAGDNTTWTRAGTDSGANWSQVNEITPNDATNYVTSNVATSIDDYVVASSGLGATDTVNLVAVGLRVQGIGASANATFVLRVKAASAGTVTESSALTPSNANWRTNRVGASPVINQLVSYVQPGTVSAWTQATVNTAQIGVRLTTANTNGVGISTLWLSVDYTASTSNHNNLMLMGIG